MVRRLRKYGSGPKSGPGMQWKPHTQHHGELDDLVAGFEIAEGYRSRSYDSANSKGTVGQGWLFWQSPQYTCTLE